ncbi:hypothetical protein HA466_0198910 [Hirschfeldia incana]|nr:hypothetical protein HA466_0198910 [Hirschfeldia incana]
MCFFFLIDFFFQTHTIILIDTCAVHRTPGSWVYRFIGSINTQNVHIHRTSNCFPQRSSLESLGLENPLFFSLKGFDFLS